MSGTIDRATMPMPNKLRHRDGVGPGEQRDRERGARDRNRREDARTAHRRHRDELARAGDALRSQPRAREHEQHDEQHDDRDRGTNVESKYWLFFTTR